MSNNETSILIATNDNSDAVLVKGLLSEEFSKVAISSLPDRAAEDFARHRPSVLILAFKSLEKAERYYLGIYRASEKIQIQPHRTIILCHKDDLKRVADLCLKQYFDDYILFWPLNHDAPRLVMSIHIAIRSLTANQNTGPSVAEFAAQARHIAELEALLATQLALAGQHSDAANLAMAEARKHMGAALSGFTLHLGQDNFKDVVEIKDRERFAGEMERLQREDIYPHLNAVSAAVKPLSQWPQALHKALVPHMESVRKISALADQVKPIILVIDDDDFQHKLVAKILGAEKYEMIFSSSAAEALGLLRTIRPDLILMDVVMPDIDGLEMTRLLKATSHLNKVPIMMISGKSEGNIVMSCLKAGAVDFAVKPFDLTILKAKVARWLVPQSTSPAS